MRLFGKCIHGAKIQILVPQKLWVAISDTAKLKIFAFTFLKPQFGTLTFGTYFQSQHLKLSLFAISSTVF